MLDVRNSHEETDRQSRTRTRTKEEKTRTHARTHAHTHTHTHSTVSEHLSAHGEEIDWRGMQRMAYLVSNGDMLHKRGLYIASKPQLVHQCVCCKAREPRTTSGCAPLVSLHTCGLASGPLCRKVWEGDVAAQTWYRRADLVANVSVVHIVRVAEGKICSGFPRRASVWGDFWV